MRKRDIYKSDYRLVKIENIFALIEVDISMKYDT